MTFNGCTTLGTGQAVIFVSIADRMKANTLNIWPNPTHGKLTIQASEKGVFTLSDAMGREVYRTSLTAGKQNLSLPALSSGIYTARYISPKGVSTYQLEVE